MSLAVDIPKIELTSENEDDDYDPNNLNFIDALTDVEDLYDDHVNQKPKNEPKKFKLKIKLNDDGGATDLEDFEASDNEDNDKIIKHSKPVSIDELDLECGTFEETYKTQLKNVKGKKKLRTQFSTTKKDDKHSLRLEKDTDGGLTDVENFDTDDEDTPAPDIPDININLDLYRNDDINISEKLSEENIDCPNKLQCKNKQFLSALSMSPNLSDITDVEIIDSDSDDGGRKKRSCKGRRRRARFNQDPVTDAEDLEVSDRECAFTRKISKKPRSKTTSCLKNRSQSLPYDSDNDDNRDLPFPICKKIAVKNQTSLQVPEFDTQILTDTEDFEGDVPFTTAAIDEEALEQKLMDIAAGYGQVQEKHNLVKGKRQYYSESYKDEPNLPQPNENNTDVDECETDSEDRIDDYNEDESYGIKFTDNEIKSVQRQTKSNKLIVPVNEDNDALTDVENINSSSEDEFSKTMPLALVKKNSSLTDEEDFQGDPSELVEEVPEITLPPAIRNLILLQDNEGNIPTIKILPLDESHLVGTAKIACGTATDEEYFSDAEEITESYHRPASPDLPLMDGGLTNVVENMHKSLSSITIPDTIAESRTDTEEIVMEDVTKRRRAPKFKTFKKFLNVEKQDATVLTDTEEIYLEDNLSLNLIPVPNNNEGTTDVENFTSDSEAELKSIRPLSCTPQHMRELGGEYILSKENSGPISVKDRSNINKRLPQIQNTTASPMYTDTEDLVASADEEYISYSRAVTATPNQIHIDLDQMSSSRVHTELTRKFDPDAPDEVMYLKGGGFIDRDTEIEDISDDEHVKIHSEVALNIKDGIVSFGFKKELDAPRKQIQLVSPERSIVEEDAVQGEGTSATTQHQQEPRRSSGSGGKAETEEGHGPAKSQEHLPPKSVSDQHQLSDEMKQLLQELEKESKQ